MKFLTLFTSFFLLAAANAAFICEDCTEEDLVNTVDVVEPEVAVVEPEVVEPEVEIENGPQPGDVKLGYGTRTEGVAMMFWNGEWGTICDQSGFNPEGWASVFCQQLDFEAAKDIQFIRNLNMSDLLEILEPLPLSFEKPNCSPRDKVSLSECAHNQVNNQDDDFCQKGHLQDVWVTCQESHPGVEEGAVRLVNGDDTHAMEGRAEMFVNGQWGTICDAKGFGRAGWPTVLCKQYLGITDSEYRAADVKHVTEVMEAWPAPADMPLAFQMPECSPSTAEVMMDCTINHKSELQACGRIKSNGNVNFKGHLWDAWVKC